VEYTWYKDRSFLAIILIEEFVSYALMISGVSSPYLANDFNLSQSEVTAMFGWFAVGLLGTLYFSKLGDRIGRRQLMLVSLTVLWSMSILNIFVTDYLIFIVIQILVHFAGGTIFATCPVMITEHVPQQYRAKTQSIAAFMGFGGGGSVILFMPLYAGTSLTWRWHWIFVSAVLIVVTAYALFNLQETDFFLKQKKNSDTATWKALLKADYTLPVICATFINGMAVTAGGAYFFYYLVTIRSMSQSLVTAISMAAGFVGMLGLFIGAYIANRYGRVFCVILTSIVFACATIGFYANKGDGVVFLIFLFLAYSMVIMASNAKGVAARMLSTELYPTHLRSTFAGVIALVGAVAAVASHFCATILTDLTGRIDIAVMILAIFSLPAAMLFLLVPETRELDIDAPDWENQGVRLIDAIRKKG